jgi:hypothetical protein
MHACAAAHPSRKYGLSWGPICCKREMQEMVRRAILRGDGTVIFCAVWHCLNCGRLLL